MTMAEYLVIFFVLLAGSVAFYVVYERYFQKTGKQNSAVYVEALQDLLDNKTEPAFTKLRQVVAEDSDNIDAYLRLGKILREHNKPDRALQVHKDLTLRHGLTIEQRIAILHQLIEDYLALNDFDTAEAALKEMISLDPQNRWAHVSLLKVQKQTRKWDEAYDTASRILKIEANKSKRPLAAFKYEMARDLYQKREYHKARVLLKEALGLDPGFTPAYLVIGDSYYNEKRYEDAVNFWHKLIETVPSQSFKVIDRLKRTLFDLGRFGDIAEICENILKHSPKDLLARLTLAEFYEKKGDLDLAEELLTRVVDDEPDNLEPILELIRIYLEKADNRKIDELLRTLEQKRDRLDGISGNGIADITLIETG
ncbi:MAG: tetratricopeptide repeat protein [candidate division Zixibacteria bacterium]|nr:tetratricopeptide repeat protein [candidate division Zixibacteria bacterium]